MSSEFQILLVSDNDFASCTVLRSLQKTIIADELILYSSVEDLLTLATASGFHGTRLVIADFSELDHEPAEISEILAKVVPGQAVRIALTPERARPELLQKCKGAGFQGLIAKPQNVAQLEEAILQIKLYWMLLDQSGAVAPSNPCN